VYKFPHGAPVAFKPSFLPPALPLSPFGRHLVDLSLILNLGLAFFELYATMPNEIE
jgi:hypothetical protein